MLPRYGSYEAIKRLAVGGMGEIFLARQVGIHGFQRLAIIKTLLTESQDDEDRVTMFLAEARIAALLNHPNVVQIYEVGEANGTYYMAMEYVDGDTLSAIIRGALRAQRHSPWPFVAFIAQAARALHHAHHQVDPQGKPMALVHRDISPQNIMVRLDGVTKVVDFGIAKVAGGNQRTKTGVMKGKVAYMAPEQMRTEELDARTDLFALGVVAWELTCGRRMFVNKSDIEIITHVLANKVPTPSSVVDNYPPQLEAVIMKALQQDAADRFQSGNDLAQALEDILRRVPDSLKVNLAEYVDSLVGAQVRERTTDIASITSASNASGMSLQGQGQRSAPRGLSATGRLHAEGANNPQTASGVPQAQRRAAPPPRSNRVLVAAVGAVLAVGGAATGMALAFRPKPAVQQVQVVQKGPTADDIERERQRKIMEMEAERKRKMLQEENDRLERALAKSQANQGGGTKFIRVVEQAAPTAQDGFLTLNANPWASVTIDGQPLGSTPLAKIKLSAGKHDMILHNEKENLREKRTIMVKPGPEVTKVVVNDWGK